MPHAGSAIVSPGFGRQAGHHRPDQRTRREVLTGAGLGVLRALLQQPLVGVALQVGVDRGPGLLVDQVHHQPAQLRRVLDPVLGLAEDRAQRARLLAERLEDVPVVHLEVVAVAVEQRLPVEPVRARPRRARPAGRSSAIFRNSRYVSCSTYSIVDTPSSRSTLQKFHSFATRALDSLTTPPPSPDPAGTPSSEQPHARRRSAPTTPTPAHLTDPAAPADPRTPPSTPTAATPPTEPGRVHRSLRGLDERELPLHLRHDPRLLLRRAGSGTGCLRASTG